MKIALIACSKHKRAEACPARELYAPSRLRLEEGIIASLHRAPDFSPGPDWLGRFSTEAEIAASGLWLKQGLDARPLSAEELARLEELAASAAAPQQKAAPAVTAAELRRFLGEKLRSARARGEESCVLVSGQLHKELGLKNRMPQVCDAMYAIMREGDEILHATPSGKSSTIEIRYTLAGREL